MEALEVEVKASEARLLSFPNARTFSEYLNMIAPLHVQAHDLIRTPTNLWFSHIIPYSGFQNMEHIGTLYLFVQPETKIIRYYFKGKIEGRNVELDYGYHTDDLVIPDFLRLKSPVMQRADKYHIPFP